MDPIPSLPIAPGSPDPLGRDLAEIDAAIGMVVAGLATRVRLVGLERPEAVAVALARSQAARLGFDVERGAEGITSLTVGPRNPEVG